MMTWEWNGEEDQDIVLVQWGPNLEEDMGVLGEEEERRITQEQEMEVNRILSQNPDLSVYDLDSGTGSLLLAPFGCENCGEEINW